MPGEDSSVGATEEIVWIKETLKLTKGITDGSCSAVKSGGR